MTLTATEIEAGRLSEVERRAGVYLKALLDISDLDHMGLPGAGEVARAAFAESPLHPDDVEVEHVMAIICARRLAKEIN